jgi:polyferredoxin
MTRTRPLVRLRQASQWVFLAAFLVACRESADFFFETDPSLMIFTAISAREILHKLPAALLFLVPTLLLGRFFCGWVCPMGTLVDAAGAVRGRANRLSEPANRKVRVPKLALWVILLVLALAGIQYAWVLDPITIAGRFVSLVAIPAMAYLVDGFFRLAGMLPLAGGWFDDAGRGLALGESAGRTYGAAASWAMAGLFLGATAVAVWIPRLWCRSLCPLGAFYALIGRFAPLGRRTTGCTGCRICTAKCRMGAINNAGEYEKGECILCMDCVYDCPTGKTRFGFRGGAGEAAPGGGRGITRAQFIGLTAVPVLAGLASRRVWASGVVDAPADPIRPPGAAKGLGTVCVRCGNCMKACPTNVIQPRVAGAGLGDLWTPVMEYSAGYCEYNCNKCGGVCPTGALMELPIEVKRLTAIGLARVDRMKCFPWNSGGACLVCEEHCPVPEKAIKRVKKSLGRGRTVECPEVDASLCIGCGICQNKCPAGPVAITVGPVGPEIHKKNTGKGG